MNTIVTVIVLLIGMSLHAGAYHLLFYSRRTQERIHLAFAVTCFTVSAYDLCCAGLYRADSLAAAIPWQQAQFLLTPIVALSFVWFLALFTRTDKSPVLYFFMAPIAIVGLLAGLFPNKILSADQSLIKTVKLPLDVTIRYYESAPGPLAELICLTVLLGLIYMGWLTVTHYRTTRRVEAGQLVFCMMILSIGALNDAAVGLGYYQSIYILEYSYTAMVLLMAHVLSSKVVDAAVAREAQQRSEQRYALAQRAANIASWELDLTTGKSTWSEQIDELLGFESGEFGRSTRDLMALVHEDDLDTFTAYNEHCALDGTDCQQEYRIIRPDGTVRWLSSIAMPVGHGDSRRLVGILQDITRRKQAENVQNSARKALEKVHLALEHRVRDRTLDLEEANRKLRQEIETRTQTEDALIRSERMAAVGTLAGGVAHEFNNINVSVLGFSQLALLREDLDPELRDFLERICKAANRARSVTQNLLAFSDTRKGARHLTDINQVVADSLELVSPEFDLVGIRVDKMLHCHEKTMMEPGEIGQVIMNLLLNAKHAMLQISPKLITVETGVEDDSVFVRVIDSGCGIEQKDINRVFSPFFTTKGEHAAEGSPQSAVRGTGLGLSVSHTIIERHGGKIAVESQPGKGSAFTIHLPLTSPEQSETTPTETPRTTETPPGRILVVDDDIGTRDLLDIYLKKQGHAPVCTDFGEEAVELLRNERFELMILDLQMPLMPGEGVLREIESIPAEQRPTILILTGHISEEAKDSDLIFDTILKPFELTVMSEKIDEALRHHRQKNPGSKAGA